jgi:bis(5'-nucleosyl)-tetraphosphatase (symmetrical)
VRWLVGDIQGCAREFEDLLGRIRFDPARDELWCLGDLVNRGPDSLATLRLWRDVGGRGVLGNHEVYALLARSGAWPRKPDTLAELWDAPDADELFARLRALPLLAHLPNPGDGADVIAVHGGVHPRWADLPTLAAQLEARPHDDAWLSDPAVRFATRVRCCTADGAMSRWYGPPQECPEGFRPWDEWYRGPYLVVHGHWAFRGHYRGPRTLGIDAACVHGGHLVAWCQEEDRIEAVPSRTHASGG